MSSTRPVFMSSNSEITSKRVLRTGLYSLRSPSRVYASRPSVTIPRAKYRIARRGQSVPRPACGVAALTLLRLPF
jgi:hypothetical protein